ncbi:MAG: hypothetical protein ABR600_04430 [Actinomycetota bacterium]
MSPSPPSGVRSGDRRLWALLLALALVAAPAAALRATCVGGSCHGSAPVSLRVPICEVPRATRQLLAAGYSDLTSPDVVALSPSGPSRSGREATVPLAFWGNGVPHGELNQGAGLADVTPTLERIIGITAGPFPSATRTGRPLAGARGSDPPNLVLEVVWRGVGSDDLGRTPPFLRHALDVGLGTLHASAGSLPVDPVAVLTTLGTGSPPSEHSVTGAVLRSPYTDELVRGWDPRSTPSALPTLADDVLRYGRSGSTAILVTPDAHDGGVVGGDFYVGSARPRILVRPGSAASQVDAALGELDGGLGRGPGTDVLVVVLHGSVRSLDAATRSLARAAEDASGGSMTGLVTATGSKEARTEPSAAVVRGRLASALGHPAIAASTAGGFFLRPGVSSQQVAEALVRLRVGGRQPFTDAFPTYALSLAGFC